MISQFLKWYYDQNFAGFIAVRMLLQTGVLEFGSVFHLSAEFLSLGSRSLARYILGVNMVTLVFIFLRVKTLLFVWMWNWTLVLPWWNLWYTTCWVVRNMVFLITFLTRIVWLFAMFTQETNSLLYALFGLIPSIGVEPVTWGTVEQELTKWWKWGKLLKLWISRLWFA